MNKKIEQIKRILDGLELDVSCGDITIKNETGVSIILETSRDVDNNVSITIKPIDDRSAWTKSDTCYNMMSNESELTIVNKGVL